MRWKIAGSPGSAHENEQIAGNCMNYFSSPRRILFHAKNSSLDKWLFSSLERYFRGLDEKWILVYGLRERVANVIN
jgi:hypothetical protein